MESKATGAEMALHLANIQRKTKVALNRFKESGVTINDDFMKVFLKLSIERYECLM